MGSIVSYEIKECVVKDVAEKGENNDLKNVWWLNLLVNKFNYTIISIESLRVLKVQESYKNSYYLKYA